MSFAMLEIAKLPNGDIVLRDSKEGGEPLVRIRFSREIRDMLGEDAVPVAEAMIEAATDQIAGEREFEDGAAELDPPPVLH